MIDPSNSTPPSLPDVETAPGFEGLYGILFEQSLDGIVIVVDGFIIRANRAVCSLFGYSAGSMIGKHSSELFHPDDRMTAKQRMSVLMKGGRLSVDQEYRMVRRDGTFFWAEVRSTLVRLAERPAVQSIVRDINERKMAEASLRKSEAQHRLLVENLPVITWNSDEKGRVKFISPNVKTICGPAQEAFYETGHLAWYPRVHPDDRKRVKDAHVRLFKEGKPFDTEYRFRKGDEEWIWINEKALAVYEEDSVLHAFGVCIDISRQKEAARTLADSEKQIRTIIESSPIGIRLTVYNRIVYANRAFMAMFGYDSFQDVLGMGVEDFCVIEDRSLMRELSGPGSTGRGVPQRYEIKGLKKNGDSFEVAVWVTRIDFEGAPAILAFTIDKSGEKALEAQLFQAQKMEAIGTLAGGIAHDFNNILAGILACTELSLLKVDVGHPARHYLEQILKAGERAGNLVKQILEFSRRKERQLIAVQAESVLRETVKLLRASLPANIEIRQEINNCSGVLMADPTQLHQIFLNLCTNAAHAMQEKGGILSVSLDKIDLDEGAASARSEILPGPHMRLTVSDTGHGIDSRDMKRIFEPYFTTKPKGEGTGMGLSVVHGIVKGLGGAINVESEIDKGTRFEVLIPVVENGGEGEDKPSSDIPGGHERILFVDDEEILTETMKAILTQLGYDVDTRTSGVEALELFRRKPDRYDLIITDQSMPKMTGVQFTKALTKLRPDIPIILCTGFSEVVSGEEARALGIKGVILKPVLIVTLAETIRHVLDESALKTGKG